MRISKILEITLVTILLVSIMGSSLVFAPPQTPLLPAAIEVINPEGVPLDVAVPDGVEVTNFGDMPSFPTETELGEETIDALNAETWNVEGEVDVGNFPDFPTEMDVEVTNAEAIDVAVPEGVDVNNWPTIPTEMDVEVTNTLDVSGWLHTTEESMNYWDDLPPLYGVYGDGPSFELPINTAGYKEITIVFDSARLADTVIFEIVWTIDEGSFWYEQWYYNDKILEHAPIATSYFFETYPVLGSALTIRVFNIGDTYADVGITYHLTT